jgi:threonine dehydratase
MVFVAPYDDPYTIAGQGTIGTELLRQLSSADLGSLHAIFVAIGGGGLIAGIAAYVKALRPDVKVIGVEPTGEKGFRHVGSLWAGRESTCWKFGDALMWMYEPAGIEPVPLMKQKEGHAGLAQGSLNVELGES